jgi:signal transduction histidine kinase
MWQGPEQQDTVKIPRASQVQMPVHQDRVEISQLKRTRLPATGIALSPRLKDWQEDVTTIGWLSTSILHDLRNPFAAIYAGAETLMDVDPLPTEAKRLATNIYRAAGRLHELLTDLTSVVCGNRPIVEMCNIREIIAAASDAASAATGNKGWRIRALEFRAGFASGCSNRSSQQVSRMAWDLGSRSPAKLFSTTAATFERSQPPAAALLSAFP